MFERLETLFRRRSPRVPDAPPPHDPPDAHALVPVGPPTSGLPPVAPVELALPEPEPPPADADAVDRGSPDSRQ